MLRVTAHKPHHIPQVVAVHGDEIIVGLIVPPGHLPGGLACTADAVLSQLAPGRSETFQHSPARTDKTIFIMLHSFCRAYEKAGIFLAFIILQTDDEALLGINIKKVFI